MLALGTLFGYAFGLIAKVWFPELNIEPGMLVIARMGALFAATVRAPITGISLVIEMTNNYHLILPLIITSLGAVLLPSYWVANRSIASYYIALGKPKLQQQDLPPLSPNS